MRLGVIGAGSTYTPELVEGIAAGRLGAPLDELVLMDTDVDRLGVVGGLAERMLAAAGWGGRVVRSTQLDAAIDGVDAAIVQFRIGGSAARRIDEEIPLRHGVLGQETVGPGGWSNALRTIPPMLAVAEALARRSPRAWLLDFANPVSIVTQALVDEGHRAVGLCNVAVGVQRAAAAHWGIDARRVEVDSVGLNHLSWFREVRRDGSPMLAELLREAADEIGEATKWSGDRLRRDGAIPSYYLRYYEEPDRVVEEQRAAGTRAEAVAAIERDLLAQYADPRLHEKPAALALRGGAYYSEAAVDLVAALCGDRPARLVVDVRNGGAIPDLPDDLVVEVLCTVDRDGARPIPVAPLGEPARALVERVGAFGTATALAARRGDRRAALAALALNPLLPNAGLATRIGEELLAAHDAARTGAIGNP